VFGLANFALVMLGYPRASCLAVPLIGLAARSGTRGRKSDQLDLQCVFSHRENVRRALKVGPFRANPKRFSSKWLASRS